MDRLRSCQRPNTRRLVADQVHRGVELVLPVDVHLADHNLGGDALGTQEGEDVGRPGPARISSVGGYDVAVWLVRQQQPPAPATALRHRSRPNSVRVESAFSCWRTRHPKSLFASSSTWEKWMHPHASTAQHRHDELRNKSALSKIWARRLSHDSVLGNKARAATTCRSACEWACA